MTLQEIREIAVKMGLSGTGRMRKGDLVRAIQVQEGNSACFGADWRQDCRQTECCWREDCLKQQPG